MVRSSDEEHILRILVHRRARYEYHILDTIEVGMVLKGTEVKSIRARKANFQDSYAAVVDGELFLFHLHISPFEKGNIFNHDPVRTRKLLASKKEIRKLAQQVDEKGLTLIPLELYFVRQHAKILLGVCKGKKVHDKRQSIKERDSKRELQRKQDT